MHMLTVALGWLLGALVVLMLGFGAYVRLAPSDPARWNVDPRSVTPPDFPGYVLMRPKGGNATSPVFDMTPPDLLAAFDRVARATPRVTVLAGSVAEGQITYIARSALWGFPDYISVRTVPTEGGAQLAVFSRLRFGSGDMGVNRARLDDWVAQIQAGGA